MNTIKPQDFLDFCYHLIFRSYQHVIVYQQISPHEFLMVFGMLDESGKCYLNKDKYGKVKPVDRVTSKFELHADVHRNCIVIVNCSRFNQLSQIETNNSNSGIWAAFLNIGFITRDNNIAKIANAKAFPNAIKILIIDK